MENLFVVFAHILATIARVLTPGGAKVLVSENLLMKQQLFVINRSRLRAPNLTPVPPENSSTLIVLAFSHSRNTSIST